MLNLFLKALAEAWRVGGQGEEGGHEGSQADATTTHACAGSHRRRDIEDLSHGLTRRREGGRLAAGRHAREYRKEKTKKRYGIISGWGLLLLELLPLPCAFPRVLRLLAPAYFHCKLLCALTPPPSNRVSKVR